MTHTLVASATRQHIIGFDRPFTVIGERINPTGRKKLAAEMQAGNFETVIKDALAQVAAGAHILDINAGVTAVNPNETEPPLMRHPGRAKPMAAMRMPPSKAGMSPIWSRSMRASIMPRFGPTRMRPPALWPQIHSSRPVDWLHWTSPQ